MKLCNFRRFFCELLGAFMDGVCDGIVATVDMADA